MIEQQALDICADVVASARGAGADAAEAYLEASTATTVSVLDGQLESVTTATARGVGARAIVGGGLGYASSADLDRAGRADLATRAVQLAGAAAPDPARVLPDPATPVTGDLAIYDPRLASLPIDEIVALVARAERAARETDRRVVGTHLARFGLTVERVAIVNSRGVTVSFEATSCYLSLSMIVRDGDDAQRGFASALGRDLAAIDPEYIGQRAARRGMAPLGGTVLPTGRMSVVLEPDVVAELLNGLAQALSGDAVIRGRSLFATQTGQPSLMGTTVAAPMVDLLDDGRLPGAPGTAPCDSEGVPTRETALIERGMLCGFMHNAESAFRMKMTSTGNGVRPSFRSLPDVATTNLVLRPGERAPAAIVASVDDGLYVVSTRNVGGINPISGDYSVGASGRRIVRGEIAEPVSGVTLAAPMLELLRNVHELGSDLRWVGSRGGIVGAPTIRIDDVMVGGR